MIFSKRYDIPKNKSEIRYRYEAPDFFRSYVLLLMYPLMGFKKLRAILCRATKESPDPSNWGENDFMKSEVEQLMTDARWYQVYDFIELFSETLSPKDYKNFEEDLNEYFEEKGFGWKLKNRVLEIRGEDSFEKSLKESHQTLVEANVPTSAKEIEESIRDLSRRPEPEITGAIQHSVAALECLSRKVTDDPNMTLGQLIKANPMLVPQPLNEVVYKLFGFASIKGRHLNEGNNPTFEEAELVVHLSAALCNYLCKVEYIS